MKTLFCLLIAISVGIALQYAGIPHGLLLGSILASASFASNLRFSPTLPLSLGYVQIVLGIATGLMFKSWDSQTAAAMLPSMGFMLLIAAAFAVVAGRVLGSDPLMLWLAYMPGAVETITIVAFSGGLNVVFILTHHLVRMVMLHFAPALLIQARRWREEV
jgi:membrane AbrB-like protein